MDKPDPLAPLRQRAYRHALEDGVGDIIVGLYTLTVGTATQRTSALALAVVYLVVYGSAWKYLSHQVSSRRIGYAEIPGDPPRALLVGSLAAGTLAMIVVAAVTLAGGRLWNLGNWPEWAPLLAGLVLAGGFLHTALRSGLWRYHTYVAATLVGCGFFWLFPFGPRINPSDRLTLFFFAVAGLVLATGVGVLVRFLRSRPIVPLEAHDER